MSDGFSEWPLRVAILHIHVKETLPKPVSRRNHVCVYGSAYLEVVRWLVNRTMRPILRA